LFTAAKQIEITWPWLRRYNSVRNATGKKWPVTKFKLMDEKKNAVHSMKRQFHST